MECGATRLCRYPACCLVAALVHADRARGHLRRPISSSFLIRVNPSDPSNPCSIPAGVGGPWPEHIQGAVKKAQV